MLFLHKCLCRCNVPVFKDSRVKKALHILHCTYPTGESVAQSTTMTNLSDIAIFASDLSISSKWPVEMAFIRFPAVYLFVVQARLLEAHNEGNETL